MLSAVQVSGKALKYASSDLRKDKKVVLKAITADPMALQFARDFDGDKEVVLAAVKQKGAALKFVSGEFPLSHFQPVAAVSSGNARADVRIRGWIACAAVTESERVHGELVALPEERLPAKAFS